MKIIRQLLVFALLLSSFVVAAHAQNTTTTNAGFEKIDNFVVELFVHADSTLTVQERITYNFGSEQKHGIFRNIPVSYNTPFGKQSARVHVVSVTDYAGPAYHYTISYPGDNIQIKIGDADKLISGVHTYVINYEVSRAIGFFQDHDELYWNVTGNEWPVPIANVVATVHLPQLVPTEALTTDCYAGAFGSKTPCATAMAF